MAKKKKKLIQEQGVCPECGDVGNLDYGDSEPDGDGYFYEFTCNKCGCYGKEWYDLIYSETIIEGHTDGETMEPV